MQRKRYTIKEIYIDIHFKYKTEMKNSFDLGFIQKHVGLCRLDHEGKGKDDREF